MSKAAAPKPVLVRILDKEFLVSCPDEERDDLLASADFLNGKMRDIRDTGKIVGIDRIAVMAALNMAHELLEQRGSKQDLQQSIGARIRTLQEKIELALNKGNQLEL
ncbi:MAG TPA: cell division protein ZapA [Gammaproteobacteria bacterium]|jgi:cell division protein ZapA|nr:cell division protein ZapA [Gammaproteobacteria bacterium]